MTTSKAPQTPPIVGAKVKVYKTCMDAMTAKRIYLKITDLDEDIKKLREDGKGNLAEIAILERKALADCFLAVDATVVGSCEDGYICGGHWIAEDFDEKEIRVPDYLSLSAVLKEIAETDDEDDAKSLSRNLEYFLLRSGWAEFYKENPGSMFEPCVLVSKMGVHGKLYEELQPMFNLVEIDLGNGLWVEFGGGRFFPKDVIEVLFNSCPPSLETEAADASA